MRNRAFVLTSIFIALGGAAAAQPSQEGPPSAAGYQPPKGPAPRTTWGKPDLNGVWQRPYVPDIEKASEGPLQFTAWGKKQWESYDARNGDYTGSCLPFGHVRSMGSPDPIQIVQTPSHLALLYEPNSWFKVFPIDGTQPKKKVPTWFGDSVGQWEDDTLVVVTTNFNGLTKLDTNGHPHSAELKLTEKFTRTDLGHIAYELTIEDPKTYTKPIVSKRVFTLRTDWEILEYSCEENNVGLVEGRIKMPDLTNVEK